MTDLADPQDDPVAQAIAGLGEPLAVHRVAGRRVQWKMTLGFGLILLGIVANVLWWTLGPAKLAHAVTHFLYMPLAFGFGLVGQVIWHRGVTVYAYPVGVLRVGRGTVETFLWDEIASVKVRSESGIVAGIRNESGEWQSVWFSGKTPFVRLWTSWIELTRNDGAKLKLTPIIDDYESLVVRIQTETFARLWPDVRQKIGRGEPIPFGPWVATEAGLTFAKSQLAWSDIKNVTLAGKLLTVGQKSFWSSGKSIDVSTLDNPHVLMALLEERVGGAIENVLPNTEIDDEDSMTDH
jgi:hypothetical protein